MIKIYYRLKIVHEKRGQYQLNTHSTFAVSVWFVGTHDQMPMGRPLTNVVTQKKLPTCQRDESNFSLIKCLFSDASSLFRTFFFSHIHVHIHIDTHTHELFFFLSMFLELTSIIH